MTSGLGARPEPARVAIQLAFSLDDVELCSVAALDEEQHAGALPLDMFRDVLGRSDGFAVDLEDDDGLMAFHEFFYLAVQGQGSHSTLTDLTSGFFQDVVDLLDDVFHRSIIYYTYLTLYFLTEKRCWQIL